MKANINGTKITRIVLAMVFASLYFKGVITGTAGIILLVAGAILLLTAFMNFCPIYHFLKYQQGNQQSIIENNY